MGNYKMSEQVYDCFECEYIAQSQFELRRHLHSAHDFSDEELDRILPMTRDKLDEILDTLDRTVANMVYTVVANIVAMEDLLNYADDDDDLKIEVEQLRELARQFTSLTFVICQVDKGQRQGTT